MQNNFGKFFVSMVAGVVACGSSYAANKVGEIVIPFAQAGKDGCDIQLQTAQSSTPGCTKMKWIKTFKTDGTCAALNNTTAWGELDVCNGSTGTPGTPACAPVATVESGTGDYAKCVRPKFQKQVWNTAQSKCVDDSSTAETGDWVCSGSEYDVCEGLTTDAEKKQTVKKTERIYTAPAGVGSNSYATAYATTVGGFTVTSETCLANNDHISWEPDRCTVVTAETSAISALPKCNGAISSCTRSDNNATYYLCDQVCQKSESSYTNPTLISGSDSNCLGNKCYSAPGKTDTSEKDGCGTGAVSKTVIKEDNCTDPMILTSGGTTYTYYTCIVGDSTKSASLGNNSGKYTLRKPLANNSMSKIVNDHTTDLASKLTKPTGSGNVGQVLKLGTGGAVTWGDNVNVQLTTFAGDNKLYYCAKSSGSCDTTDSTDDWTGVDIGSLQGDTGKTSWIRNSGTAVEVCYKATPCTDNDTWLELVKLDDITGPAGADGKTCQTFSFEQDNSYQGSDGTKYLIYCND